MADLLIFGALADMSIVFYISITFHSRDHYASILNVTIGC